MAEIAEKAEFVGRESELSQLSAIMKKAASGQGQIAFVHGEAGVGKTRIIEELGNETVGRKFTWLTAKCLYNEGTDPYLPFKDALRAWFGQPAKLPGTTKPGLKKSGKPGDISAVPVIGARLAEDPDEPSGAFMIKEAKTERSIEAFSELVKRGRVGLCITRIPPDKLGSLPKHENTKVYWLSKKPGEYCIPPSLSKLSHEIMDFIKSNHGSVVLLDGLEYVTGNNDFNKVINFVNELVDSMAVHKGILIMPIDPLTMEKQQLALMERDMTTVDLSSPEEELARRVSQDAKTAAAGEFNEDVFRQGRDRMFETITQQIINIAATKPVALFIDDLHWADTGALHLLHYLSRAVQAHPVAVLGSYRPEELADAEKHHPPQEILNRMIHEKLVNLVPVERLDKKETGKMISSLLKNTKYPKDLDKLVFGETEGNPFFIEEVLRSMAEQNFINFDENKVRWNLTRKIPDIEIPQSIRDVVMERNDRLNRSMRVVLESASVLGVEFEYDILADVSAMDEEKLVTDLDDLLHLQLLKELPCGVGEPVCYRFSHNKICEVLYEGLGAPRKRLLHKKIAKAFEDKYENDLDIVIFELAQHYYKGGDYRRGLHYLMKAGEKAIINFAPEKAIEFYRRALESIELIEIKASEMVSINTQKMEIYTKLSELCTHVGEWDDALECTEELLKLSSSLDDDWKQADAHVYEGQIHYNRSQWEDAQEHYTKALELAERSNYDSGLMKGYFGLGAVYEKIGEFSKAMEYFQNFMGLALPTESAVDIAKAYKAFAVISSNRGDYNTSLEYLQKSIELLSKTDQHSELAKAYTGIGVIFYELGKLDKVIEMNEKCIELTTRTGDIRIKGYGYSNAAEAYAKNNDLQKAVDYAQNALEIFTKLDEKPMLGLVWMNFGIIHRTKKEWGLAREYFERSIAILQEQNIPYYLADSTRQLGIMLAEVGTKESKQESKKFLEESLKIYRELGAEKYITVVSSELDQLK